MCSLDLYIWLAGLKFTDRDLPMILYMIRKREFLTVLGRVHLYQASYAATRGLFFSHMGWIFYKPNYERMDLIDRDDLDNDPGLWSLFSICQIILAYSLVVRFQHKYYG